MISNSIISILSKAIKVYDPLSEKDFLVVFSVNRRSRPECVKLRIRKLNFWHLLGCKGTKQAYELLLAGITDINALSDIDANYSYAEIYKKKYDFYEDI